jgi:hypothetical protein
VSISHPPGPSLPNLEGGIKRTQRCGKARKRKTEKGNKHEGNRELACLKYVVSLGQEPAMPRTRQRPHRSRSSLCRSHRLETLVSHVAMGAGSCQNRAWRVGGCHVRQKERWWGCSFVSNGPIVPSSGLNKLHQHVLKSPIADPRYADLSRDVACRRRSLSLQGLAPFSLYRTSVSPWDPAFAVGGVTYDTHGARGAIDIHPVVAVVRIEIFTAVFVETTAATHGDG